MESKKIIFGLGMAAGSLLSAGMLCVVNHWTHSGQFLTAGFSCLFVFVNYLGLYLYYNNKS